MDVILGFYPQLLEIFTDYIFEEFQLQFGRQLFIDLFVVSLQYAYHNIDTLVVDLVERV